MSTETAAPTLGAWKKVLVGVPTSVLILALGEDQLCVLARLLSGMSEEEAQQASDLPRSWLHAIQMEIDMRVPAIDHAGNRISGKTRAECIQVFNAMKQDMTARAPHREQSED